MAPSRRLPAVVAAGVLCACTLLFCVTADDWTSFAEIVKCDELRLGQFVCEDPEINHTTQEPRRCTNYTAFAPCFPAPNISCKDYGGNVTLFTGKEIGFFMPFPCRNVNGYSYKVAVALSLFLGWLGADRFYLGYPALGMLKFCTVGFCGIGCLIDFILISMQASFVRGRLVDA
ncbi:hypothetical protein FKM82_001916 [Ascaphus truei]